MEIKETSFLHCFKFHHFGVGVDTNTITAISTSYAFYLVTIATFKHILSLVRNLIHVKPSRYWGAGFLGVGLIFCVVLIFVLIFWIRGYTADTVSELIHVWQFFMVSTFVTMHGGWTTAQQVVYWYKKLHTKAHARSVDMPLVHYNTHKRHLHNLNTWPPKPVIE